MWEALAWPAAAALVACTFMLLFRQPIAAKISQLKSASKHGAAFDPMPSVEQLPQEKPAALPAPMNPADIAAATSPVLERERQISHELDGVAGTDAQKVVLLKRALSSARLETEYTRHAHLILGSQSQLLLDLGGSSHGQSIEHARSLYEFAKGQYPAWYTNRSFEQWLEYLLASNFVVRQGDILRLTDYAAEFLKFLVDARLTFRRSG